MPQIDPELSEKVFVVLDALFVQFPRDFVLKTNTIKSTTKNELCIRNFEENVAAFCFKNTSKMTRKVSTLRFCATCVLLKSFWSQNVGKPSTKTELIIQ